MCWDTKQFYIYKQRNLQFNYIDQFIQLIVNLFHEQNYNNHHIDIPLFYLDIDDTILIYIYQYDIIAQLYCDKNYIIHFYHNFLNFCIYQDYN